MPLTTPLLDPNLHSELWGDGGDGAVAIGVNTALTRDMNYTNLTILPTFQLDTASFIVRCTGSCILEAGAEIDNNGNSVAGQVGGAALAAGSLGGSQAGTNGGAAAGAGGNVGANAVGLTDGAINFGLGGVGGIGDVGTGNFAAGTVAAFTAQPAIGPIVDDGTGAGLWTPSAHVLANISFGLLDVISLIGGGGGSGGGGGAADVGGGGGGGGGIVVIFARTIIISATSSIRAIGGFGGDGAGGDTGGGGGGGGGGHIILVYEQLIGPAANINANGNIGGFGAGIGANGAVGTDGTISLMQI